MIIQPIGQFQRLWLRQKMKRHFHAAKRLVAKRDHNGMIAEILKASAIADRLDEVNALKRAGLILMQLGCIEQGWRLKCAGQRKNRAGALPEWDGGDLKDRTLLICPAKSSSIGKAIRYSRFIAPVARQARRCIVIAEPRMVPILRRTFPEVDVRNREGDNSDAVADADVVATFETLGFHLARSNGQLRSSLIRLRADPARVAEFRRRFQQNNDSALVGFAWWSANGKKDLPDLASWSNLLRRPSTTFVSLQYGYDGFAADLDRLCSISAKEILQDSTIDQFADIDGFAAQVAALDAVVTVSNTTIHIAGDFGVPSILLRDDLFYGMWPLAGPTPWYPDMTILYRSGRPWFEVLGEARVQLDRVLGSAN